MPEPKAWAPTLNGRPEGHSIHEDWGRCFPELRVMFESNLNGEFPWSILDIEEAEGAPRPIYPGDFDAWAEVRAGASPYEATAQAPGNTRLCLAVSTDGRGWDKTGLIIAEHAGVPTVGVEDGVLYVYCNMLLDGKPKLVACYTTDLCHWRYRGISDFRLGGLPTVNAADGRESWVQSPQDPTLVAVPDGKGWWMFFTLPRKNMEMSESLYDTFVSYSAAVSSFSWQLVNGGTRLFLTDALQVYDGAGFYNKYDGRRLAQDPSVLWTGAKFEYFASPGSNSAQWHFTFSEVPGTKTFVIDTPFSDVNSALWWDIEGHYFVGMCNGAEVGGDYVGYGMVQQPTFGWLLSYTRVGGDWVVDNGGAPLLRVDRMYESVNLGGAAVTKFGSCYVMVYSTRIPADAWLQPSDFPAMPRL